MLLAYYGTSLAFPSNTRRRQYALLYLPLDMETTSKAPRDNRTVISKNVSWGALRDGSTTSVCMKSEGRTHRYRYQSVASPSSQQSHQNIHPASSLSDNCVIGFHNNSPQKTQVMYCSLASPHVPLIPLALHICPSNQSRSPVRRPKAFTTHSRLSYLSALRFL
ncbi:hypothetical protein BKA80DRAFT_88244 [Phyllosticta citrichinensis]